MNSGSLVRICGIVVVLGLVLGSLLTFPAYLPWMMGVWCAIGCGAACRRRPMWPWLLPSLMILAMKRPGFTWEFWLVSASCLTVGILDFQFRRNDGEGPGRRGLVGCFALLIVACACYGITRSLAANTSRPVAANDRPIVCLGDSLTAFGYPQELEKLISVPIEDFGVSGITTDDGIKMIPDILATRPQLVVIELGGHDYNSDRKSRRETRSNLLQLIQAFREHGIEVVIVEIPRGFVTDPYDGLERELASKYDLQLVDDSVIRSFVFNSPILPPGMWRAPDRHFSRDGLHPNQRGNEYFARRVAEAIARVLGKSILQQK